VNESMTPEERLLKAEETLDRMNYVTGPQGQLLSPKERLDILERIQAEALVLTKGVPPAPSPEA